MNLEAKLAALLAAGDVRALVRALCACARVQLPRAQQIDPFNAVLIETAEAWAAGRAPLAKVREVARQASHTRGGAFTSACVRVIVSRAAQREDAVRQFARQLPTLVWSNGEAGRAWAARAGLLAKIGSDPEALAGVAAVDAELTALAAQAAET